jgi:hypothetical protein
MTEYAIDIVTARDPCSECDLPYCLLNMRIRSTQQIADSSVHVQQMSQRLCYRHCYFLYEFSAGRSQENFIGFLCFVTDKLTSNCPSF